jgi:glycosyltransferase involved in cell wall biosynthesis
LNDNGFEVSAFSFLDDKTYRILYKKGFLAKKILGVLKGFFSRVYFLLKAYKYDFIFMQREATPLGPPIFEWFLSKILRKKIIYDFDDAIWIPDITGGYKFALYAKCFWKIKYLCKWSYKISAGNRFLADWARQYNPNVVINPTVVDMQNRYNPTKWSKNDTPDNSSKVVIGWTGSHSTLPYLDIIFPVLQKLETHFSFEFLVICNQAPSFHLKSLKFIQWQEATEIEDLLKIDIGIMPLYADAWSEGKCGFKLIQYLALGIPAAASPVGVNKEIIDGENGFLCATEQEWLDALSLLLSDASLRRKMGKKGREQIQSKYSLQANTEVFLGLFE